MEPATLSVFVGILLPAQIGIGNARQSEYWDLQAITSSVIGGTSLFGAVGLIHGSWLGSFILTTIDNGADLLNLTPFWWYTITGGLISCLCTSTGGEGSSARVSSLAAADRAWPRDMSQAVGDRRLS